jgi:phenylalanyl-tRNA synthetase alpha chain
MDTIYVDRDDDVVLRTHTSPVQARVMTTQAPPIAVVCPGGRLPRRRRRRDPLAGVHQVEGLLVAEGVTMAHLRGTLLAFARAMFGADREIRLRPSFFPFTEPSAEIDVSFEGARQPRLARDPRRRDGRPQRAQACGIDPDRYTGFAFGIGSSASRCCATA